MELALDIFSLALLALAAVAYVTQNRVTLTVATVLFLTVSSGALFWTYLSISPILAGILIVSTIGVSALCLILFLVDLLWAPFCLEMTYLTVLCWILCPLAVALSLTGTALKTLL